MAHFMAKLRKKERRKKSSYNFPKNRERGNEFFANNFSPQLAYRAIQTLMRTLASHLISL